MQSWRFFISSILVLACSVGVVACSAPTDASAVTQGQTDSSRVTFLGNPPAWAATADAVMAELEQWRGLSFTDNLQVTFQPQDDPGLNGWYNSQTKELVVALNGSEEMGRGVLLHEIFHALQDQNFDLYQLRLQSQGDDDRDKALSAIIEGEAMWAVSDRLNYDFLAHARLPQEGEVSEDRFEKIFLYGAGMKFIQAVHEAGGWDAVNGVFQDPPRATALILEPSRYLAGERDVEAIAIPLKPGETLQAEQVRGLYQVQLLLARFAETRSQLDKLSQNYVADTLGIVEDSEGQVRHRWVIELSDPAVATELEETFSVALNRTESLPQPVVVSVEQSTIVAQW